MSSTADRCLSLLTMASDFPVAGEPAFLSHGAGRRVLGGRGGCVPGGVRSETAVPTDPLIYRWYEIVNVYGMTIKELIHEEFGDGIMSAIDFSMDREKVTGKEGETRVQITLNGKWLPYKQF